MLAELPKTQDRNMMKYDLKYESKYIIYLNDIKEIKGVTTATI